MSLRRIFFIFLFLFVVGSDVQGFIARTPRQRAHSPKKGIGVYGITESTYQRSDYLITDSLDLEERPSLARFLLEPRNLVASSLILSGLVISASNIVGNYGSQYATLEVISIALGFVNGVSDCNDALPPYQDDPTRGVSANVRSGVIDDALIHLYSGTYTLGSCWLALRTSPFCPSWVTLFDGVVAPTALLVFVFSLAAPVLTLMSHYFPSDVPRDDDITTILIKGMVGLARGGDSSWRNFSDTNENDVKALPELSELELMRSKSLVAIGIVGCIYAPIAASFLIRGQDWWIRTQEAYPGQSLFESTTALYGIYATQGSMIGHRMGKRGIATFATIVPTFTLVCFFLTVLPCVSGFYWLGNTISFFRHYSL